MLNIEFCCSYSRVWLEIHANIQVSKHPALHPEDGISPRTPQAALVVLPPCLFKQQHNTQTQQPQQVKQTCTTNKQTNINTIYVPLDCLESDIQTQPFSQKYVFLICFRSLTKQPWTWSPRLVFGGICKAFDTDSEYDGFRAPSQML
jgi:hypothetical protein